LRCPTRVSSSISHRWADSEGQATDIDIHAREILRIREITNTLMSKHTGQSLERIERDVERDFIMNSQQAKEYGIVDEIIDRPRT
jgi:ATP-dependent Clp protease protease subunit